MSLRSVLLALALAQSALAAGCSSEPTGPHPGGTPPGEACSRPNDCYCWKCICDGVSGPPGQAQLCVDGKCPSGEEACTTSCSIADAGVVSATSIDTCNGVP